MVCEMRVDIKLGLVSVVVANYNHAKFLVRRVDSLINQTYQDIEILIIDDCSTDHSVAVLRRYESNPKVRLVFRQQNGGVVAVMNQGIELSSGEFVIFAQCDDDCDALQIERLVSAMKAHPTAGIAYCRSLLIDEDDRVLGDDFSIRERSFRARCATDTLIGRAEMGRFLMSSCVIPNMSAALIRRECFSVAGKLSPVYRVCCDWDLFFRIVECYDVAYVAEPMNKFRQHESTVRSVTKNRVVYEEYIRVLLGHIKVLNLTALQRARFRAQVMSLWAGLLLSPTWSGVKNFPYHVSLVIRHDALALLYLGPALIWRIAQVGRILLFGRPETARHKTNGTT